MNIAFYTYYECCPSIGGTERTTSLVANSLKTYYGFGVFSIYQKPIAEDIERYKFEDTFKYTNEEHSIHQLLSFIREHNIQIIINQGGFEFGLTLSDALRESKINCKQIFALHFVPGSFEKAHINFGNIAKQWKQTKSFSETFKLITYPIYHFVMNKKYKYNYNQITYKADKIVLLSPNYIRDWLQYANLRSCAHISKKITSIPNGLSFNYYADFNDIANKEPRALIVARLDEKQKKLTQALKIWKDISKLDKFKMWQLDIVGDGPDSAFYKKFTGDNDIQRVNFYGRQNPETFYRRAAIFLMTSAYEGFGMTLIEASQFGVVPIVFETFGALRDILQDNINGYIIEPYNISKFQNKLCVLMEDSQKRFEMSKNAVINAKRFSLEKIAEHWQSLFRDLYAKTLSKSNS